MIDRRYLGMVLSGAVLGVGTAARANLVTNGSFESPTVTVGGPGYDTSPLGTPSGWTVTPTIDLIGPYWQAQDGVQSVDVSGNNAGALSQVLVLVPGATYNLTFWMSGNPDGPPPIKTLDVSVGTLSLGTFSYDTAANANTHADMKWELKVSTFVAPLDGSSVLKFAAQSNSPDYFGGALDNVSVELASGATPVPLPASFGVGLSMLSGFGGLFAVRKRMSRRARIA